GCQCVDRQAALQFVAVGVGEVEVEPGGDVALATADEEGPRIVVGGEQAVVVEPEVQQVKRAAHERAEAQQLAIMVNGSACAHVGQMTFAQRQDADQFQGALAGRGVAQDVGQPRIDGHVGAIDDQHVVQIPQGCGPLASQRAVARRHEVMDQFPQQPHHPWVEVGIEGLRRDRLGGRHIPKAANRSDRALGPDGPGADQRQHEVQHLDLALALHGPPAQGGLPQQVTVKDCLDARSQRRALHGASGGSVFNSKLTLPSGGSVRYPLPSGALARNSRRFPLNLPRNGDRPHIIADPLVPNTLYMTYGAAGYVGRFRYCNGGASGDCTSPSNWCPPITLPSGAFCQGGCHLARTADGVLWIAVRNDTGCTPPTGYNTSDDAWGIRHISNLTSLGSSCITPVLVPAASLPPEACIFYKTIPN